MLQKILLEPAPSCPGLNVEAARMYKYDRPQFDITAREWTQRYAT